MFILAHKRVPDLGKRFSGRRDFPEIWGLRVGEFEQEIGVDP